MIPVSPEESWHKAAGTFEGPGERMSLKFVYEGKGAIDLLSFELS